MSGEDKHSLPEKQLTLAAFMSLIIFLFSIGRMQRLGWLPRYGQITQPMTKEVLKLKYRSKLFLDSLDDDIPFGANVLDGIILFRDAWSDVSATSITNCFHHCGFFRTTGEEKGKKRMNKKERILVVMTTCLIVSVWLLLTQPLKRQWKNGLIVMKLLVTAYWCSHHPACPGKSGRWWQ